MIEASIDCHIRKKEAPDNIGNKFNCLLCVPNNRKMYSDEILSDVKELNPCVPLQEETVSVLEIVYNNKSYFYRKLDNVVYLYEYDKVNDIYVEISPSSSVYQVVINSISY